MGFIIVIAIILVVTPVGIISFYLFKNSKTLVLAARKGNLELVKKLLLDGVEVDKSDFKGLTSLIPSDTEEILKIKNKHFETTPLIAASAMGHLEIVKILLENGADVDKADDIYLSPLIYASLNGHLDVIKLLLKNGASFSDKALICAEFMNHETVVIYLKIYKKKHFN